MKAIPGSPSFSKYLSWIVSALIAWWIVTELIINGILNTYLGFEHGFVGFTKQALTFFTNPSWDGFGMFLSWVCVIVIGLIAMRKIEHYIKLFVYRRHLPSVRKELKALNKKINEMIIYIVGFGKRDVISQRDNTYADLLRHMQAEFDIEGVAIETINACTDKLDAIISQGTQIEELYALTNLEGDSWLTRTMLLYFIRTIQLAGKIKDSNKKARLFIRKEAGQNKDCPAYKSILLLHDGFLPVKEITMDDFIRKLNLEGGGNNEHLIKYPAFLYIKEGNGTQYVWHLKLDWRGGLIWITGQVSSIQPALSLLQTGDIGGNCFSCP